MINISTFLNELCSIPSPSGFENNIDLKEFAEDHNAVYYIDNIKNQYISFNTNPNNPTIMLSAHLDELGFRVTKVEDNGYLRVMKIGGVDIKAAIGQRVLIHTDNDTLIHGVIGKRPIHVESQEERKKVCDIEDLIIDYGCMNNGTKADISVGNYIVFDRVVDTLCNNLVCSPGLDDKSGCAVLLDIIQKYADNINDSVNVVFCFAAQEEEGLRGANIAASRINPDIAVDFDVTFATDEGRGINEAKHGKVVLGGGPVFMHGSDKDESLIKDIKRYATVYQDGCSRPGGTNTSTIQLNSFNAKTLQIAIPNRNMHTPVEIVSLDDLNNISEMIFNWLIGYGR